MKTIQVVALVWMVAGTVLGLLLASAFNMLVMR
jgi:hypothetical protein